MVLKRVGPGSLARILGVLYAVMGVIIGGFMALATLIGSAVGGGSMPFGGAFFGVAAILWAPVLYGVMGVVTGLLSATLYNWLAGVMGGVEVTIE